MASQDIPQTRGRSDISTARIVEITTAVRREIRKERELERELLQARKAA